MGPRSSSGEPARTLVVLDVDGWEERFHVNNTHTETTCNMSWFSELPGTMVGAQHDPMRTAVAGHSRRRLVKRRLVHSIKVLSTTACAGCEGAHLCYKVISTIVLVPRGGQLRYKFISTMVFGPEEVRLLQGHLDHCA